MELKSPFTFWCLVLITVDTISNHPSNLIISFWVAHVTRCNFAILISYLGSLDLFSVVSQFMSIQFTILFTQCAKGGK